MAEETTYEIRAVKYAERDARRGEHFLGGDPHDGPMPMDYFVWTVTGGGRTWVVDTGFEQPDADARGRRLVRSVTEALAAVDVDAATIDDVIVTHLHYDHIGGFDQFPRARFHVQDREVAYATGRHMTKDNLAHAFTADHIAGFVRRVFDKRVVFHDGDAELAPGLSLHLVGGHTDGLQVVRVSTAVGPVVLASDAAHYYENFTSGRPFPFVFSVGDLLEGFDTLRRLAGDDALVVPGHDPQVLVRYPAAGRGLEGIAARLDVIPRALIGTTMARTDWNPVLRGEFDKPYWAQLQRFVYDERHAHPVFPPHEEVFAALELTPYADTKVLILGQDPYHGPGQAHGLCFSVRRDVAIPPSLRNIYTELHDDLGITPPDHGNLESWARQGVLLLNAVLTVRAHAAASHRGQGWETFTDEVIAAVNAKTDPVVFILWGGYARRKKPLIDLDRHTVVESPHPSPLSAHNGFFGSRPFSQANAALVAAGRDPVDWTLPD